MTIDNSKLSNEEFSGDTIITWLGKNVQHFNEETSSWEMVSDPDIDEGFLILSFIDNKNYIDMEDGGRCKVYKDSNGEESMTISVSGTGVGKYYKTINNHKIFRTYDLPEGYYYIWCNEQNTLQIYLFGGNDDFNQVRLDKYFETFNSD